MTQQEPTLTWSRRLMRRPGSSFKDRQFVPKMWHIQGPGSGTYCGVNVVRFLSDLTQAPLATPPEGELCKKCLRQYPEGHVLPQGGGSSWRKG